MGVALFGAPCLHHLFLKIALWPLWATILPAMPGRVARPSGKGPRVQSFMLYKDPWALLASSFTCTLRGVALWHTPQAAAPFTYATCTHTGIHIYIYNYHSSSSLPTPPTSTPSLGPAQGLGPAGSQLCTSGAAQEGPGLHYSSTLALSYHIGTLLDTPPGP